MDAWLNGWVGRGEACLAPTASRRTLLGLLACIWVGGCQTFADGKLIAIQPPLPAVVPAVEHTVGEFTFTMGGGVAKPSTLDGKLLSQEIMKSWKKRGYIRSEEFVKK